MKFSINHAYKFKNFAVAFMSGWMQSTMIIAVELVNILSILSYSDTLNVVICFMALAIIAEFDNFFYDALGENKDKELITNPDIYDELLYTIRRTTSYLSLAHIEENHLNDPALDYLRDPKNRLYKFKLQDVSPGQNYIHLSFKQRSCLGKFLAIVYRIYKLFYVTFWFYFLPFTALLGSFFIPYFVKMLRGENETAIDPEVPQILPTDL